MNMENEKINEGNVLIAEFMGEECHLSRYYYLPQFGHYRNSYGNIEYNETFSDDQLKYHSSWDWLMPVVEKIAQFPKGSVLMMSVVGHYKVQLYNQGRALGSEPHGDSGIQDSFIYATWLAVINFIKWYNEHLKDKKYGK
jgi:hypothetical protein